MSINSDGMNGNVNPVSEEEARSIGGNVSGGGPSPESEPGSVVAGNVAPPPSKLTKADFVSGQKCAGVRAAATIRFSTMCRR